MEFLPQATHHRNRVVLLQTGHNSNHIVCSLSDLTFALLTIPNVYKSCQPEFTGAVISRIGSLSLVCFVAGGI
jgi:hypothetical protein